MYTFGCNIDCIFDSRASHHVTPCKDNFVTYKTSDCGRVHLGNKHYCNIVGVGDVPIRTKDRQDILLKLVRHIP